MDLRGRAKLAFRPRDLRQEARERRRRGPSRRPLLFGEILENYASTPWRDEICEEASGRRERWMRVTGRAVMAWDKDKVLRGGDLKGDKVEMNEEGFFNWALSVEKQLG